MGVELPDGSDPHLSGKVLPVSARLSLNPSEWSGIDLNLVPPSLAVGLRAGEVNTMLFGETNLGCWRAGIAQGIPLTGLEVVTLGLTAGEWPEENVVMGSWLPEFTWWPLLLGSVSYHVRSSSLRITPSLIGGYYWGAYGEPGRWLLALTVSGTRREDHLADEQLPWQPAFRSAPGRHARLHQ